MTTPTLTAKIYKLLCDDESYYFGSTKQARLSSRVAGHRRKSTLPRTRNTKLYSHIRELGGWSHVKIELVESFPFTTDLALRQRETFFINEALADAKCLNLRRAFRSNEQRLEDGRRQSALPHIAAKRHADQQAAFTCPGCKRSMTRGNFSSHLTSKIHNSIVKENNERYRVAMQALHAAIAGVREAASSADVANMSIRVAASPPTYDVAAFYAYTQPLHVATAPVVTTTPPA